MEWPGAGRVMRLALKCGDREEARAECQWVLQFLVTHSLVTSKAGRQQSWWGGRPPNSKWLTYFRGVEGSLVGTTWFLGNLSQSLRNREKQETL